MILWWVVGLVVFGALAALSVAVALTVTRTRGPPSTAPPRGIVLFDIEGVLSVGSENGVLVAGLVEQGFLVGVLGSTDASFSELRSEIWFPAALAKGILDSGMRLFNNVHPSHNLVLGARDESLPNAGEGARKAYAVPVIAASFGIPLEAVVFVDDSAGVLRAVGAQVPAARVVCGGPSCKVTAPDSFEAQSCVCPTNAALGCCPSREMLASLIAPSLKS